MGMVDVTEKPVVRRRAEASGRILLSPATLAKIREGDMLLVAGANEAIEKLKKKE